MGWRGTWGSTRLVRRQRELEEMRKESPLGLPWEGIGEAGLSGLQLASLNNSSGLWGTGAVSG